jgi:hypothetical protein
MNEEEEWVLCDNPVKGDTLKWNEPLWAKPNKPRGKPDKIGEQQVVAEMINSGEVFEFKVLSVKKLSSGNVPVNVKEGDYVRRKKSTLKQGKCHKRLH